MTKHSQEISISLILVILLVLMLNPFGLWMPNQATMMLVVGLVVVFALFASLIWKERPRDERERYHSMMADRIAYLAGSSVLVVGILVESLMHELEAWLVVALSVMILGKIFGLIYSKLKH